MRSTRRDRQRGSMILILAGAMTMLTVFAIGSITVYRVVLAKQEVQQVADSACLTATTLVKNVGLPFPAPDKVAEVNDIAQKNHPNVEFAVQYTKREIPTRVDIDCQATLDVSAPFMIWSSGKITVSSSATGTVKQETYTEATRLYPRLVLVLDYSGSMTDPLANGSGKTSIAVLRSAINALLDLPFKFRYGLVIFATDVLDSVKLGQPGESNGIRKLINNEKDCPEGGEGGCSTHSWLAITQANKLLMAPDQNQDEAGYVLFVSDGQPHTDDGSSWSTELARGEKKVQDEVKKLWANHFEVITLHIINTTDQQETKDLKKFMVSISGTGPTGNEGRYFNADSDQSLTDAFTTIGNSIACPIGPLVPKPPEGSPMHVFVRDQSGLETVLLDSSKIPRPKVATNAGDLSDQKNFTFYQGNYFFYRPERNLVYVTPPVCDRIIEGKEPLIVRYGRGQLTE
jgi:Flp pilus assembly protein TadG